MQKEPTTEAEEEEYKFESRVRELIDEFGLTVKQAKFALELNIDFNATQATIRAGYSEESASEIGYENLRKPQIEKAIAKLLQETDADRMVRHNLVRKHWVDIITAKKNHVELDTVQVAGMNDPGEDFVPDMKKGYRTFKKPDKDRAAIELGKIDGLYPNTKVDLNASGGLTVNFSKEESALL